MSKIKVFISYSHNDRMWVEQGKYGLIPWLEKSLLMAGVEFWYDFELRKNIGEKYKKKITEKITDAHFAVLLVSQDFLSSKFIREVELSLIQKRVDSGLMEVIPILVDYANSKLSPNIKWIKDRQMLPSDNEPLIQFIDNKARWHKIRADILDAFTYRIDHLRDYVRDRELKQHYSVSKDEKENVFAQKNAPIDFKSRYSSAFDKNKQLNTHLFSFNLSGLLLRAAKRRNKHSRSQITMQDLIGGIIRKGDLTRTVLFSMNKDPDEIYKTIGKTEEAGKTATKEWKDQYKRLSARFSSGKISNDELEILLNYWFVRDAADFSEESKNSLTQAVVSAVIGSTSKVSELDFLNILLPSDAWKNLCYIGLPEEQNFKDYLDRIITEGSVDHNGNWNFEGLDQTASMVIARSHSLAQKYGYRPISHRVIFTSLVYDDDSFGRALLGNMNKNADHIIGFLLGTLSGGLSETFGMSFEACHNLVIPMIEQAKKMVGNNDLITDEHLFWAFLELASDPFKSWLLKCPFPLNINELLSLRRSRDLTLQ